LGLYTWVSYQSKINFFGYWLLERLVLISPNVPFSSTFAALSSDLTDVTGKYFDGKVEKPMLNSLITDENCAILRERTEEILNNRIAFVDDHEVSAPLKEPLYLGDEVHEELPGDYLPDHKAVHRSHWGSVEGNESYVPEVNED
jgi:hypothetical protein